MIRFTGLLMVTGLLSLFTGCGNPVSVLVVTGGHSYDTAEFIDMFRSMEGIEFDSVVYPEALSVLDSDRKDEYDLLLFYDFLPGMPQKDSVIFRRLTHEGKPMLFLHHALATFQEWDGYREMVGGRYEMADFQADTTLLSDYRHDIDLQIKVLDRDHPVTRGIDDFVIHDEGYSNIQINEEIHPLFGTDHPDCAPLVGWVNTRDQSNIVYLMMGHDKQSYVNESFQQILLNSINWLAH